ncbi:histone H3-like centromeric protein cid [Drosophila sulfurigaster albostrigata]|uniref:histone H3-like centromeric protein cid n=1 Tax=Drosophila sulfurigaster albostrigata TaxID=89887 RepID=UPI002D21EE28|nr:histone H3-like centromeric protein cid [Drosophila sulfurigaster albostrigata]
MRPQRTPIKSKAKKPSKQDTDISDDETQFQSPELNDGTDYGLEFTTSHISPLRHPSSTLRKADKNPQHDAATSNSDADEDYSSPAHSNQQILRRSPRKSHGRGQNDPESSYDEDQENQTPSNTPTNRPTNKRKSTNFPPPRHHAKSVPQSSQITNNEPDDDEDDMEESSYFEETQQSPKPSVKQSNQRKSIAMNRKRKQSRPERRDIKMNREIIRLRNITETFLIPRLPFSRLVRELLLQQNSDVHMVTMGALEALQTASEMYLTQRFEDAYLMTKFRGRVTLEVRDLAVVAYFCKSYGGI